MKLKEKIVKISNEISISKDLVVSTGKSGGYKAISEAQIKSIVKLKELEHKISIIPTFELVGDINYIEKSSTYNGKETKKVDTSMTIKCTLKVEDLESDETLETVAFGQGLDSGDKAIGKANTYAYKYALMNLFKIATDTDEDSDNKKNNIKAKSLQQEVIIKFKNATKGMTEEEVTNFYKKMGISKKEWIEDYRGGDYGKLESLLGLLEMNTND